MRKSRPIQEGDLVRMWFDGGVPSGAAPQYTDPGIVVSISPGKHRQGCDTTVRVIWPDQRETIETVQCLENLSGRITIAE